MRLNQDWLERFQEEAQAKHKRGVDEYRHGDESIPFDGDLLVEYCAEQLDSVNYLFQMMLDGKIPAPVYEEAFRMHFQLWWMVQERMANV